MSRVTSQSPPSPDIWRCDIPMWRQAGLISTDLLSLSLLPGHWQYFPRSVHLWTCCSRSSDDCHVPCWPSSTTTQQSIPMGNWPWTTTPSRVHSGQTKEGVPKWSTHHILCWFTLSTYAQHLGQNDRSTHPSGPVQTTSTSLLVMSTHYLRSFDLHQLTPIWSWSIKI